MAKGISLHIGLNQVDPAQYEGWDGALTACEFDANDMQAIAKKRRFSTQKLLTKDATSTAVLAGIAAAAKKLAKGDLFLLTYSGHGGQVRDTNGDDTDGRDETWVLFDRQLVDDELYAAFGRFKAGVRIFVLSDSCHSGTVVRAMPAFLSGGPRVRLMPPDVGAKVEAAHKSTYRAIQKANPPAAQAKVKASVLLVSGCMDNQLSRDGDRNGLFTENLRTVWKNGKFKGSHRRFRDAIAARMPADQTPNFYRAGVRSTAFEAQSPFTI